MSRVEILQEMQLVIQEQLDREDIVLSEATKLNDLIIWIRYQIC